VPQKLYRTREFNRTFMAADLRARHVVNTSMLDIIARGTYQPAGTDLRARIIDDWFLYFRCPYAGESYDPDSYVLLRVVKEPASGRHA
jgi:hypothetical protein